MDLVNALSELRERRDSRNALHALRLRSATFPFNQYLRLDNRGKTTRWWSFYQMVMSCSVGLRVETVNDLEAALQAAGINDVTSYLIWGISICSWLILYNER